mgnify:CR=1 FL=1
MTTQRDLPLVWASGGGQTPTGDAKYVSGWVAEIPSFQNFNYVLANATGNILVQAEQGHHNWDVAIQYQTGAQVVDGGLVYACHTASIGSSITGAQPSLDATFSYWVTGAGMFGPAAVGELKQTDGILIDGINTRASAATWDGNDVTIKNSNAIISFNITSATVGLPNWSLANVNGEMLLIDNGISTTPTGKSIAPGAATVSRIYHEAHPPTQSEVSGTIPDSPTDGPIYGRSNANWVKVTSTTVSTSPPPPVAGSGQGWYNLDDGTTYVDVDDGDSSQWVPASPPTLPFSKAGTNVVSHFGGTSGTYTIPDGLQSIKVTMISGGGAGGAAGGTGTGASAGGGGGAGAFAITHWLASELPSSVLFSVGLGSTSISQTSNPGSGGATTFYDVSLNGGSGGVTDVDRRTTVGRGEAGGLGGNVVTQTSTGTRTMSTTGAEGSIGAVYNSTSTGGDGAGTYFGGGGAGSQNGSSGGISLNHGGGGGGAGEWTSTGRFGGNGGDGILIVEETYHY